MFSILGENSSRYFKKLSKISRTFGSITTESTMKTAVVDSENIRSLWDSEKYRSIYRSCPPRSQTLSSIIPRKIKFSLETPLVGFKFKTLIKLYPKQVVLIRLVFPAPAGPKSRIFKIFHLLNLN